MRKVIRAHFDGLISNWTNSPAQWAEAIHSRNIRVRLAHFADGFDKEAKPTAWLDFIAKHIAKLPRIYLDLSHSTEMLTSDGIGIRENFRGAFVELLSQYPEIGARLMYGSDWHMPKVAVIGRQYYKGMRGLIPQEIRNRVMGMTGVDFFGLRKGYATRHRLEDFHFRNKVPVGKVPWLRKLKQSEQS